MRVVDYMRKYCYLSGIEADILFYRDIRKLTYDQIGSIKKLSKERIRQIYNKAQHKINMYGEASVSDFCLSIQNTELDEYIKNHLFREKIFTIPQLFVRCKESGYSIKGIGGIGARRIEEELILNGLTVYDIINSRHILYDLDEIECSIKILLNSKNPDYVSGYLKKYYDAIETDDSLTTLVKRVQKKTRIQSYVEDSINALPLDKRVMQKIKDNKICTITQLLDVVENDSVKFTANQMAEINQSIDWYKKHHKI